MKKVLWLLFLLPSSLLFAQTSSTSTGIRPLTVQKIMRDPKWIGTSPSDVFWSPNSQRLYFKWNPTKAISDSLYFISLNNHQPQKATYEQASLAEAERYGSWNKDKTKLTFVADHELYLLDVRSGKKRLLMKTSEPLSGAHFGFNDQRIVFHSGTNHNLFSVNLSTGEWTQLTNFVSGEKPKKNKAVSAQEQFLESDALYNSLILRQRKSKKEAAEKNRKSHVRQVLPKKIYIGKMQVDDATMSPDGRFVFYRLIKNPKPHPTIVPQWVTTSGYTETEKGRPVVGVPQPTYVSYIYDRQDDTTYKIAVAQIPGIKDIPKFYRHYPKEWDSLKAHPHARSVYVFSPTWNKQGTKCFVVVRSLDHKDRWIMALNPANGRLKLLNRQHDEAWIAGPGIGWWFPPEGNVGWLNNHTIYFQSEKSGYSQLYELDVNTGQTTALTQGRYEVYQANLSADRKTFYIVTNKVEPSQLQYYLLDVKTKKQTRITTKTGGHEITVSPDGKYIADLFSTAVDPWELYLQKNKAGAHSEQITHKAESKAYRSYPWRKPDIVTFTDRDGFKVYAEVYRPKQPAATHPGVIFVHGAGYLQDVLRYWGYYFREHMFMNFLVDKGYTVMDIDYRGSAGYGRDWRTAIYRHMGGNDLEDIVDGAHYMADSLGVNAKKIGIWGGSYGGFMTLMAMFKSHAFVCGAALRSVTDWAHYNPGYTSAILNLPQNDSLAYVRSSPIYFAKGLQGHLLMCHGMVDPNVHFQDIVRLTQKLIELGKRNWQLAVYPVEGHAFTEPSSWTDEYRRVYQLFERWLK